MRAHRVTPDLIQHTQYCHRSTISNITLNTPPGRNRSPPTARSSSLRCVSADEHHTPEQYSKRTCQNPESISREAIYHGALARTSSRCHVFEKLVWKPSEGATQISYWNQISLPKYQGHQTPSA